jgi:PKD repeat protein
MNCIFKPLVLVCLFFQFVSTAQNEARKWYFGYNAGLDFSTSPPTVLTNGALYTDEGCATISDPSGNLLFYTDGSTVWNASHVTMANGTGLFGNSSTTQSALIVRQPGSANIFHIFTLDAGGAGDLCFSTVNMSLASGSGSVITKNILLASNMTEKLTGAKHCNGIDYWVITHEDATNNFKSFLVTPAGVSVTPVISATGPTNVGGLGTMKSSPNGKMLASSRNLPSPGNPVTSDVFNFDQTTGQVSFQYSLYTGLVSYGCEFSPNGTKLYIAGYDMNLTSFNLAQFDMCAGSATAVSASMYTMSTTNIIGAMQVAPDGKVYCARIGEQIIGVINNPNSSGALCNFVEQGLSIAPNVCQLGLPNFAIAYTPSLSPFTHTVISCQTATFNAPSIAQTFTIIGCASNGYSVTGLNWNFGDPGSGAANTSTFVNPQHTFTSAGTYTTTFIINYSCGGGSDTIKQVVNITNTAPSLSVSGSFTVCKGEKRIYTVSGANTYTWNNNANTTTVSLTNTVTTSYTVSGTNTTTSCKGSKIFTVVVKPCTGIETLNEVEVQVNIYPNPAEKLLHIENRVITRIQLLNHQGQLLIDEVFEPGQNVVDLIKYEDGVYFMRIINNSGSSTRRFVKKSN